MDVSVTIYFASISVYPQVYFMLPRYYLSFLSSINNSICISINLYRIVDHASRVNSNISYFISVNKNIIIQPPNFKTS